MISIKTSIKYAEYMQYLNITIYCYYIIIVTRAFH